MTLSRKKTVASTTSQAATIRKTNRFQAFLSTLDPKQTCQKNVQSGHASVQSCNVPNEIFLSAPSSSTSNGTSRSSSLKTIRESDANILLPPGFKSTSACHEEIHQDDHLGQIDVTQITTPVALDVCNNNSNDNNDNDAPITTAATTVRADSAICSSVQSALSLHGPSIYRQTGVYGHLPTRSRSRCSVLLIKSSRQSQYGVTRLHNNGSPRMPWRRVKWFDDSGPDHHCCSHSYLSASHLDRWPKTWRPVNLSSMRYTPQSRPITIF